MTFFSDILFSFISSFIPLLIQIVLSLLTSGTTAAV